MELFSEIYSAYYHAIKHILREGSEKTLTILDVQRILAENSFSESAYQILPKLQSGDWPLLKESPGGYTTVCAPLSEYPLTKLQLAWLKAILSDPRIRLFFDADEINAFQTDLADIPQLFYQENFYVFDKAKDGDDFDSEPYQRHFRVFLDAIHNRSAVSVQYEGGKGNRVNGLFWPYRMEYSSRDDKLRASCYRKSGMRKIQYVLNLGRIVSAQAAAVHQSVPAQPERVVTPNTRFREVTLEVTKERNALERCMVQFAHFEKRTEYDLSTDHYTCTVRYNVMDETELVIRVLSFGPTVKVLSPEPFINEIKSRVAKQYELIKHSYNTERA
jgi:hypothetical protein